MTYDFKNIAPGFYCSERVKVDQNAPGYTFGHRKTIEKISETPGKKLNF